MPEVYVEQYGRDLRFHVLNPDTKIIEGILGAKMEANGGPLKIHGYHVYNDKTGFSAFFDEYGRRYRTGFIPNESQKRDRQENGNML